MRERDDPQDNNELTALIADYQSAKDDQRSMEQSLVGVAAIAVIFMGAFVKILGDACGPDFHCMPRLWPPVYAVLPMAPLSMLSFLILQGALTSQRAYYIRTVERRILRLMQPIDGRDVIPMPAFEHLTARMRSHHRGHSYFRVLVGAIYFSIAVVLLATTAVSVSLARPIDVAVVAALFYGACAVALAKAAYVSSIRASRLWRELAADVSDELSRTAVLASGRDPDAQHGQRRSGRSFVGYLCLPRRSDIIKALFFVVAAVVSRWLSGGDSWPRTATQIAVGLIALEFLAYQGRYILNDLRTATKDAEQSAFKARERLPVDADQGLTPARTRTALGNVILRFALAIYVALRFATPDRRIALTSAVIGVYVLAAVYERLRQMERLAASPFTYGPHNRTVLVVVGLGYVIRTAAGWSIGAPGTLGAVDYALLVPTLVAFGSMFVAMTFVFQSLHLVAASPARPESGAKWNVSVADKASEAPHKVALLGDAIRGGAIPELSLSHEAPSHARPLIPPNLEPPPSTPRRPLADVASSGSADRSLGEAAFGWKVLRGCGSARAWWNRAFVVAVGLGTAFGVHGASDRYDATLVAGCAAAVVSLLALKWPITGILACSVAPVAAAWASAPTRWIAGAALLPVIVVATYVSFRSMTLAALERDIFGDVARAAKRFMMGTVHRTLAVFVGESAAASVIGNVGSDEEEEGGQRTA